MNTLTSGLNTAGEGIGKGVGGITSGIGKGVGGVGKALGQGAKGNGDPPSRDDSGKDSRPAKPHGDASGPASGTAPPAASTEEHHGGSSGGFFHSITSGVTSGASFILAPTADAMKSGATLARDATTEGFSIGQKIAKSGLDVGSNVVTGTASFTGTALNGVISTAAETSGAAFEPIGSGLKTIQGLDKLGQGMDAINGLAVGAVSQVSQLTTKALNMSGKVKAILISFEHTAEDAVHSDAYFL